MKKSLGNKRHRIGDPDEGDADHIAEIAKIHGQFTDGETRTFTVDGVKKTLVVSKVFDNEDFGFNKITVERPLRLNFQTTGERIALLDEKSGFKNLVASAKKNEELRQKEIEAGQKRQEDIRALLRGMKGHGLYTDRAAFLAALHGQEKKHGLRLNPAEKKAVLIALGERDESAEICCDRSGDPEPDAELRDTENVPLKESIEAYFKREVLPHVPDAWIDESKTKVGYEIPSVDYTPDTAMSQQFFATVQNKMHWAVHGQTAAEVIHARVDRANRSWD